MRNTLSKFEWAVMSALWAKPRQTLSGVIETMGEGIGWKYTTYATYVKRMCDKGLIGFEQLGRDKFYYPIVDKRECVMAESKSVREKIDGRATMEFLIAMIQEGGLSDKDRIELKNLLDKLEEGEKR